MSRKPAPVRHAGRPPTVYRAHRWPTNAHLIADAVVPLRYIRPDDVVLDPTHGIKGGWWTRYRPQNLIAHDLILDGVDYRHLPEADGTVDVIAYDPAYVGSGSYERSTVKTFRDTYGIQESSRGHQATLAGIVEPFPEFARVLRPARRARPGVPGCEGGLLLLKCQNYVVGGHLRTVAYDALAIARAQGWTLVDEFYLITSGGPQPLACRRCHGAQVEPNGPYRLDACRVCDGSGWTIQQHARANVSILYVLRRP